MSENEIREQLLGTLTSLSNRFPQLRVAQLISNAIPSEELQRRGNDIYYIKDVDLLSYLREYESKLFG